MGRKRRLRAANKKFRSKHSMHPIVLRSTEEESQIKEVIVEVPTVEEEEKPVIAKEPSPEVLAPVSEPPESAESPEPPKPKVRKKRTTRKRTSRKKAVAKEV